MKWCEACGSDLAAEPAEPCVACGERDISDEGYCMTCGHKQPEERDHMVFEAGAAVAVTDRGLRHRHNEDAAAVGELPDGGVVLVVCDGVSSTPGSAEASLAAATAARDLLVSSLGAGRAAEEARIAEEPGIDDEASIADEVVRTELGLDPTADNNTDNNTDNTAGESGTGDSPAAEAAEDSADEPPDLVVDALLAATVAAQTKASEAPVVVSNAPHSQGGPPSSTYVAAVARRVDEQIELSVAWLGDSRAYWIGVDGAVQLTGDHEQTGSLTRWLGADSLDTEPDLTRYLVEAPGRLLLCSDGLWRYAEPVAELTELVGRLESGNTTSKALAEALVDHAIDSGGHDNITVALWPAGSDAGLREGNERVDE